MIVLETSRLILAELAVTDAPFIVELVNSPGWLQFIGDRGIKNIDAAESYIINGPQASYAKNGFGLWRINLKENNKPIGMCGILKRDNLEYADIGFALLPQYAGYGYAQEAAAATLAYAKDKLQLYSLAAITLANNERSINLLTKIGLRFEKNIVVPPAKEELMLFLTA